MVIAVATGSLVKSVTGMGLPVIAIPVIALFVSTEDAVVVMAMPGLVANAVLCAREREHRHEARDLGPFALLGIVGAVAGTLLLVRVPDRPLLLVLVALVVYYVVTWFARPDVHLAPHTARRFAPAAGFVAGIFQGATGISGPVVVTWFHGYRLPRGVHIFSVTFVFQIGAAAQFVVLVAEGQLDGRWGASFAALVPTLAMIPIGTRLRDRLHGRAFDLAVLAILSASAVGLLVDAIRG